MRRKSTLTFRYDDPGLQRMERLGYLLDASIRIPGIGYRIGYDAIIGLIPGFGDAVGLALSSYIVVEAARAGAPPATLLRMVVNVAIESIVGAIPVIGDLFDAMFKANLRNIALLEAHVDPGSRRVSSNKRYFAVIVLVLILFVALLLFLTYLIARAVLDLFGVI